MRVYVRERLYILGFLQTSNFTTSPGALQKAADFVRAFMLGFDAEVHKHTVLQ